MGEPSGESEVAPPERPGRHDSLAEPEARRPAGEVVRDHLHREPGRIRERYGLTGSNRDSVAFGVRSTGSIITGAALIMVAVFAGIALGDLVPLQQAGFGLGVAVIIDATLIRSVIVPASMAVLGRFNWYLPKWLEWLPEIRVEGDLNPDPESVK